MRGCRGGLAGPSFRSWDHAMPETGVCLRRLPPASPGASVVDTQGHVGPGHGRQAEVDGGRDAVVALEEFGVRAGEVDDDGESDSVAANLLQQIRVVRGLPL